MSVCFNFCIYSNILELFLATCFIKMPNFYKSLFTLSKFLAENVCNFASQLLHPFLPWHLGQQDTNRTIFYFCQIAQGGQGKVGWHYCSEKSGLFPLIKFANVNTG